VGFPARAIPEPRTTFAAASVVVKRRNRFGVQVGRLVNANPA
jgi:hypothetical protein